MMKVDACLKDALDGVSNFIAETTGTAPTQEEIADALRRFFVLQEERCPIFTDKSCKISTLNDPHMLLSRC